MVDAPLGEATLFGSSAAASRTTSMSSYCSKAASAGDLIKNDRALASKTSPTNLNVIAEESRIDDLHCTCLAAAIGIMHVRLESRRHGRESAWTSAL